MRTISERKRESGVGLGFWVKCGLASDQNSWVLGHIALALQGTEKSSDKNLCSGYHKVTVRVRERERDRQTDRQTQTDLGPLWERERKMEIEKKKDRERQKDMFWLCYGLHLCCLFSLMAQAIASGDEQIRNKRRPPRHTLHSCRVMDIHIPTIPTEMTAGADPGRWSRGPGLKIRNLTGERGSKSIWLVVQKYIGLPTFGHVQESHVICQLEGQTS